MKRPRPDPIVPPFAGGVFGARTAEVLASCYPPSSGARAYIRARLDRILPPWPPAPPAIPPGWPGPLRPSFP